MSIGETMQTMGRDSLKRGSAVAVGNFDGFHLGHREIVETVKTIAAEKKLVSVILTFTPNPKVYFKREHHLICTEACKKAILEKQGADHVVILNFAGFVDMSAEVFLKECLIETFHMRHIVMGENFRFGRGRQGDITFLQAASQRYNFEFSLVKPVMLEGLRISSTYIREQLAEGNIELCGRMLGRAYFIEGVVTEGDKIGRQLGFPTINVNTENTLLPEGVFKTTVEIEDEDRHYCSVTYIGYRPTFRGKEKKVESHIFGFDRKIYGKRVKIFFEKKIRGEMKFTSQRGLIKQIRKDIENLTVDKECIF